MKMLLMVVLAIVSFNASASEWVLTSANGTSGVSTTNPQGNVLAYLCDENEFCAVMFDTDHLCQEGMEYPMKMTVTGDSDVSGSYDIQALCTQSSGTYILLNNGETVGNRGLFYGWGWILEISGKPYVFNVSKARGPLGEMLR